jgi:hypothetical protein
MDALTSAGSAAAMVSQNLAAWSASIAAAGADPGAATVAGQSANGTAAQFSVGVLKKALDLESTTGSELAQMIQSTGSVDFYA